MRSARVLAFPALALLVTLAGPPPSRAAGVPDSLAEVKRLFAAGRPGDPALAALVGRVLARRQAARRARPADVAEALEMMGRVRLARVEYPEADSLFSAALVLRRSERRPEPRALLGALAQLAEAQRVRKALARADSTAREGLRLLAVLAPPDTALELMLRSTLGNVLAERREGARARDELARVVQLAESRARPDSLQLGQAHRNLGRALAGLGDVAGARASYARAAAVQEAALGPDHPDLATSLYLSAMAASDAGDYVAQRRDAERALAIRERTFGPTHPAVAITASTLGGALRNLGDAEGALPHYERAVAIQRGAARPNPFDLALALNNLGGVCLVLRDGVRARALFEEARAVREGAFGPGSGASVWGSVRLAQAMALTGDRAAARAELDRALASVDSVVTDEHALDLAEALGLRGCLEAADDRHEAALAAYTRAHALSDRLLGPASPRTLEALAGRAILLERTGRTAEAWLAALELESRSLEMLRHSARALSEHEALAFERTRASGLGVMLASAGRSEGVTPAWRLPLADAVARARLVVLDQLADERRSLPRGAAELAGPVRELEAARDALAAAMVTALRQERPMDSTVVRARARREAAERALAERSARFELDRRRSGAGWAEAAAALPSGSALVSYVRHADPMHALLHTVTPDSALVESRFYSALVMRAGAPGPEVVTLGPAAPIEAAVERWVEACATPPSGASLAAAAERRVRALGRAVDALVLGPLTRHLAGSTRVFVVPDGALHAVNMLALPDASGRYRAEAAPLFHRLIAERDLLAWDAAGPAGRGLLAMGGADFDHGPAGPGEPLAAALAAEPGRREGLPDTPRLRFAPLPQTAAEVGGIAALWRASHLPDAAEVRVSVGAAASEGEFKRLAPGHRVLHVATHGFALGGGSDSVARPGLRAVGAVVSGGRPPAARRAARLPGLALAGANVPAVEGGDDGFLTAEEITSLDLVGAEWAVLSACETGLSDLAATEAVQGLQRAFRRAGLRTVIMSLWAVDDEATRAWMHRLYEARFTAGLGTADAVREAGRRVLHERRARGLDTHPFHWAAFVASGDWR